MSSTTNKVRTKVGENPIIYDAVLTVDPEKKTAELKILEHTYWLKGRRGRKQWYDKDGVPVKISLHLAPPYA